MKRPTQSRRTLLAGVAVAAAASLALSATGASATSLGTAARSSRLTQTGPASDISLSIVSQSPLITNSSGTFIFALLQNPNAAVLAVPSNVFAATADNAAGTVIGAATPKIFNHPYLAPGGQQLYAFAVPAGTDHVSITNPSAVAGDAISDPLGISTLTPSTDSNGFTTITATVTNPSAFAQRADVTILFKNAAGQIIGADPAGYTTPSVVPASGSAAYSDFLDPSQTAGVASYSAIIDGTPDNTASTYLPVPFAKGQLVLGSPDTITGTFFTNNGQSAAGRTLQFIARSNGVPAVIGTTTTGAGGQYTFSVKLPSNAQFSIVHPSDADTFGTSTGDFYFPLTPVLTVSHLKTKTLTAKKHKTFQITGSFPGFTGEKIYLELRDAHGHYKVVTFTRVSGAGGFTFKGSKLIQSKAGKYTYRVEAQASGLHSDISSTFTVKVS